VSHGRNLATVAAIVLLVSAFACSDSSAPVDSQSIRGLVQSVAKDSTGSPPPSAPSGSTTPGYFRGTVRGSEGAQGPDTLGTSVKIANVAVAAYPRLASAPSETKTGPLAASTTTNDKGEFQLPELPGGDYVVTFTPPQGSKYAGVWVTATAHAHSSDFPWWVTLPVR
jgi:hypothetical protein